MAVSTTAVVGRTPLPPPKKLFSGFPVREWRREKRQEKDAGFSEPDTRVLVSDIRCQSCTVFIGRDHAEQECYLYPVIRSHAKMRAGIRYYSLAIFHVCGDCARRKNVSEDLKLFGYEVWQQTEYIPRSRIIAVKQILLAQIGTTLYFWDHHIPANTPLFVHLLAGMNPPPHVGGVVPLYHFHSQQQQDRSRRDPEGQQQQRASSSSLPVSSLPKDMEAALAGMKRSMSMFRVPVPHHP